VAQSLIRTRAQAQVRARARPGTTGASNSAGNDLPSRAHKYFTPDRRNKNLIDPARINIHNSLIVKQFSNRDYNFNLPDLQAMKLKVRIPSHIG